jgi:D-cysteine desulfhydrase family pyridoxal phosphate-dependent enzyme
VLVAIPGPDVGERLDAMPRVDLGHWPTPLEPCHRLRDEIGGPLVWLKRDDCSGLALGGNKTRKLEFLLGTALADGATGMVTFGARQSNHARQTAAACARLGMPCDLVLTEAVDRVTPEYRTSGNHLLDGLLGATVHVVADDAAAIELAARLAEEDPGRCFVDPGGSNPTGTMGYVAGGRELADQLEIRSLSPAQIVVAASTGGTAAGLALGLASAGVDAPVTAVAVYRDAGHTAAVVDGLLAATAAPLGVDPAIARWTVDGSALGDGYGIETEASHEAVTTLARTEGVLLDPVYTAKAFAALLASLPTLDPDADVVFVHTGGQPGLFAYADSYA